MVYKTFIIKRKSSTKKMALAIEQKANEMLKLGWTLITFSITPSLKAILVFTAPDSKL